MDPRHEKALKHLIGRYPALDVNRSDIVAAFHELKSCFSSGGKLLVCGNGGSAADSEHIVGELGKGFVHKRPLSSEDISLLEAAAPGEGLAIAKNLQGAFPAISLVGHAALSTAFANDVNPMFCFAQQLFGLGKPGDLLIAITTSGQSANVLYAAKVARAKKIRVIGLTGKDGGALKQWSDVCIVAPGDNTGEIQEYHLPIYHVLCAMIEEEFFGERPRRVSEINDAMTQPAMS